MALFTAENAAEMGRKAAALAKQRKEERERIPATVPIPPNTPTDEIKSIELSRVRSRLDTLDSLMSKAKTDREWDNLSRAYERVFRAWVHLAGIPGPGQRKPAPERSKPSSPGSSMVSD